MSRFLLQSDCLLIETRTENYFESDIYSPEEPSFLFKLLQTEVFLSSHIGCISHIGSHDGKF